MKTSTCNYSLNQKLKENRNFIHAHFVDLPLRIKKNEQTN